MNIKENFYTFCRYNSYLTMEDAIEYFSVFGGLDTACMPDFLLGISHLIEEDFAHAYHTYKRALTPSYLLESPYREILMAVARGDGRYYAVLRKAKVSESVGASLVETLLSLGVLSIERSREQPLKQHPKQKLKKELRHYRIQDKLRFNQPFYRFWFGFVEPHAHRIERGDTRAFKRAFKEHYERLRTLVFEQLCNAFLVEHFASTTPLISHGSYWNQHSEFDILAVTSERKLILGECKYKDRKVCKNELNKLEAKALHSGMKVDTYVLFSKSGFSNELLGMQSQKLLLFDLHDLQKLC